MWVLGMEPGPPERAASALNSRAISPAPFHSVLTTSKKCLTENLSEFEASLVYKGGSRKATTVTQRNPENKPKQKVA